MMGPVLLVAVLSVIKLVLTHTHSEGVDLSLDSQVFSQGAGQPCGQLTCRVEGHSATVLDVIMARVKVTGIKDQLLALNLGNSEQEVEGAEISGNGVLKYNRASIRVDVLSNSSCDSDIFTCQVSFRKHSGEMGSAFTSAGPGGSSSFQHGNVTCNDTRELDVPAIPATCDPGMGNDRSKVYPHYVIMTHSDINQEVVCDTQTDGGGWIVFQRRVNGDIDFYRNWTDYRNGFGDLNGDFWLGNQAIGILTNTHEYKLRIDFRVDGRDLYAEYTSFKIQNEHNKYRLRLGFYSGTIGERDEYAGMTYHNNLPFSTYDQDNDRWRGGNCAINYHGGWWYRDCHAANLNGQWGVRNGRGIKWYDSRDSFYPSFTEMKIRRLR